MPGAKPRKFQQRAQISKMGKGKNPYKFLLSSKHKEKYEGHKAIVQDAPPTCNKQQREGKDRQLHWTKNSSQDRKRKMRHMRKEPQTKL